MGNARLRVLRLSCWTPSDGIALGRQLPQALADRVIVIVAGRVVAEGTPDTLGGRDQAAATVRFRLPDGIGIEQLPPLRGGRFTAERDHVEMAGADLDDLGALFDWARGQHLPLPGLTVERPSLEDVYLTLTGGVR